MIGFSLWHDATAAVCRPGPSAVPHHGRGAPCREHLIADLTRALIGSCWQLLFRQCRVTQAQCCCSSLAAARVRVMVPAAHPTPCHAAAVRAQPQLSLHNSSVFLSIHFPAYVIYHTEVSRPHYTAMMNCRLRSWPHSCLKGTQGHWSEDVALDPQIQGLRHR